MKQKIIIVAYFWVFGLFILTAFYGYGQESEEVTAVPQEIIAASKVETKPAETGPVPSTPEKEEPKTQTAEYKAGELLIKFKTPLTQATISQTLSQMGLTVAKRYDDIGVYKCSISREKSVMKAMEEFKADANVEYAEPNYIYHTFASPNDPRFPDMFGLDNIDAPEAWDKQTGSKSVVIGVIDTGTDQNHEDLKANIWKNTGEIGFGKENNGIDDDGNGYVDDFEGWDFINNDNNPFDDNDHGTHVSGTIGAVGNNQVGVVGVNWSVSIMPLKFLSAEGSGESDDAVEAIIYATKMGAKVLSNSWGGIGFSRSLEDAIKFAHSNGVIFVAAAGNESKNNDSLPTFPASYEVDNVIAVAASTRDDNLASFSNWGKKSVDLAAPGSNILSTLNRNRYGEFSGTSMATPHVSGAAALIWAQFPNLTMKQVKIRVLGSVDRNPNLTDRVATGGRLNVNKALSTSPIIANTTRLENTLDEVGPYVVESDILDDGGIQTATLTYQVEGQEAVTGAMTLTDENHYRGEIPGQPLGSTMVYFVSATDGDGNQTKDRSFTFSIAEPTDGGACGCGKPALDFAIQNPILQPTVNALANLVIFIVPLLLYKVHSDRKKKQNAKNKNS